MLKNFEKYVNVRIKLMLFSFADRMANASANLTAIIIFVAVFSLMFLFLSLALGFYIGEKYDSFGIGFFAVGTLYFVILIVLFILKKALIINPIRNKILLSFLNPKPKDEQ